MLLCVLPVGYECILAVFNLGALGWLVFLLPGQMGGTGALFCEQPTDHCLALAVCVSKL